MDTREQLELPESRSVSVTSDIAANVGGKIWLAALNLGFTPIYLTLLGVEAFGLIGFYSTLLIAFTLFDVGLSSTLNREMARSFHDPHGTELRRDLLKTLQAIYFLITVAMIVAAITGAGLIAHYWVKPDKLSPGTIEVAVQFMGIATAFQMLFAFYSGGLLGLRKQVLYNIVNAAVATLRFAGSVLVLFVFSRTVEAFFLWQAAVNAFGAVAIACILWRVIPRVGRRARFSCGLLSSNWRFAGGLWATTVAGFLLGQADKVVVSKIASLESFGYYSLAATVAASLRMLGDPVYTAFFPVFSRLATASDVRAMSGWYHRASQIMSVAVLPMAGVMIFFPKEVVFTWTGSHMVAESMAPLVRILACGTAFSLLSSIAYALQLAYGWTRLGFLGNMISLAVFTPALVVAVQHYGATGAAVAWALLNLGYLSIGVRVMHCRLLPGEHIRWYFSDVALPAVAVCAAACALRVYFHGVEARIVNLFAFGTVYAILLAVALLAVPGLWGVLWSEGHRQESRLYRVISKCAR